jgi:signal transduction histidine kinase
VSPTAAVDALLDHAPCGFVSFADDGTIQIINRTLCDWLDIAGDDVTGRSVETLFTVGTRIFYQTHLFPLVRMHGHAEEIFMVLRRQDGSDLAVLANAVRRDRDRSPVTDCVFMVIRERRKFEEALLQAKAAAEQARQEADEANRAKSTFLAVMSHELRTPLNAIAGYLQLLEMEIHGPLTAAQRTDIERIGVAQTDLLRLINDVLNLSRIESGKVHYADDRVAVAPIVTAVAALLEQELASRELTVEVGVDPSFVAHADSDKVRQIVLNLLTNALKFTPAGGRITITARRTTNPDRIAIAVTDTGIGIDAGQLVRIFEPFVQVESTLTRSVEGTGLGLAISRDLARGMGGDLVARSVLGEGSTFELLLRPWPGGESLPHGH